MTETKNNKSTKKAKNPDENAVFEHIADYIIQTLIKEDVNAFAEATLIHELLVYKLTSVAQPLMCRTISETSDRLKTRKDVNLIKEYGGINQQKRISFRSTDQYNAFVMLFFNTVEEHPELLEPVDGEETFEKFMIHCIHDFRERLDGFAKDIAKDKTDNDYKNKLYIKRLNADLEEAPTYADYIAERIDSIAG